MGTLVMSRSGVRFSSRAPQSSRSGPIPTTRPRGLQPSTLVLGDDSLHVEAGYASMTRGRMRNHIDAVSAPDPNDPTVELRRALARSTAKESPLELGGRGP